MPSSTAAPIAGWACAPSTCDGRRPEICITVSDHGPGIPPADLPHIFEPFYRGSDAVAGQIHGNGLGLSLVKRIAARTAAAWP